MLVAGTVGAGHFSFNFRRRCFPTAVPGLPAPVPSPATSDRVHRVQDREAASSASFASANSRGAGLSTAGSRRYHRHGVFHSVDRITG